MLPRNFQSRNNEEEQIRERIVAYLKVRQWYVKRITGNKYQSGLPDLFATHRKLGPRWIEVKLPGMRGSKFTPAQLEVFPKMQENGSPIWILTDATWEQYKLLLERKKGNLEEWLLRKL